MSSSAAPEEWRADDQSILKQIDEIKAATEAEQPLVGELVPTGSLADAYLDNPVFLPKIASLAEQVPSIRKTRGDGSCFYRSFLISLGEHLMDAKIAEASSPLKGYYEQLLKRVEESEALLEAFGYPSITVCDFKDSLVEYLQGLAKEGASKDASIYSPFSDKMQQFYVLTMCRCLASLELLSNEDAYFPYILGTSDCATVKQFCDLHVDAVSVDADQVQVMALANWFRCKVKIAYLDATPGDKCQVLEFPQTDDPSADSNAWPLLATVLYRPGHYDIAYFKE